MSIGLSKGSRVAMSTPMSTHCPRYCPTGCPALVPRFVSRHFLRLSIRRADSFSTSSRVSFRHPSPTRTNRFRTTVRSRGHRRGSPQAFARIWSLFGSNPPRRVASSRRLRYAPCCSRFMSQYAVLLRHRSIHHQRPVNLTIRPRCLSTSQSDDLWYGQPLGYTARQWPRQRTAQVACQSAAATLAPVGRCLGPHAESS